MTSLRLVGSCGVSWSWSDANDAGTKTGTPNEGQLTSRKPQAIANSLLANHDDEWFVCSYPMRPIRASQKSRRNVCHLTCSCMASWCKHTKPVLASTAHAARRGRHTETLYETRRCISTHCIPWVLLLQCDRLLFLPVRPRASPRLR